MDWHIRKGFTEEAELELQFFFFPAVLGLEFRAFTLSHYTSPIFVKGFFEIGFLELFRRASFKPQSS
jgi:hypothetical protein